MSKINVNIIIYTVLLFSISFSSCKKEEEDNEKPTISDVKTGNNDSGIFYISEIAHFEFMAKDNMELASYRVNISKDSKGDPVNGSGWSFSKTYTIASGKKEFKVVNESILIPDTISSGNYEFKLTLYDKTGNYSIYNTVIPIVEN